MSLLSQFDIDAKIKDLRIGIGLGGEQYHNKKILNAAIKFLKNKNLNIILFGEKRIIRILSNDIKIPQKIILNGSDAPEEEIIKLLAKGEISAAIRGSLSSSKFLSHIHKILPIDKFTRVALLETCNGHQFFYGPVGIDECNTTKDKIKFIFNALKVYEIFDIVPKVSILSGGRIGDIGRDPHIDRTIKEAEEIVDYFKKSNPNLDISHEEILIESAVAKQANLIIAPDGISGNLVYRTLVHLGSGKAYGAIYSNVFKKLNKIIIDTSRVGEASEITGSLILSLALASKIK